MLCLHRQLFTAFGVFARLLCIIKTIAIEFTFMLIEILNLPKVVCLKFVGLIFPISYSNKATVVVISNFK